jgi:hypothetical protein
MDPFTIAMLVSAASSAAGVGMGAMQGQQAQQAANAQNDIALRQFYANRRTAQQQEEMARAGTRNARGDVTEYVPGVGWVERPSATTQGMIAASDQEQRLRLTQDMPRARMLREDNFGRQLKEGAAADAMLSGINTGSQSVEDLRGALIRAGTAKASSGADDMRKRIGLVSLRSGSGGEQALAQLGRNRMADTRTAIAEADLEAPSEYVDRRGARTNSRLNQYGALAARASAPDGVPFTPTVLDERLSDVLRSRANMAPQALGNAMSLDGPRVQHAEDRTPVGLDSIGQYLQGLTRMAEREGLRNRGTYNNNPSSLSFSNVNRPVSYNEAWQSTNYMM